MIDSQDCAICVEEYDCADACCTHPIFCNVWVVMRPEDCETFLMVFAIRRDKRKGQHKFDSALDFYHPDDCSFELYVEQWPYIP